MGLIILKNIRTFSYHGCLEEEAKIGSNYRTDLKIETNLTPSALSDNLSDTVDYVLLNHIVVTEMAIRANLLEHVAYRIKQRIIAEIPSVLSVKISVSKLNPPIGGDVQAVSVVLD